MEIESKVPTGFSLASTASSSSAGTGLRRRGRDWEQTSTTGIGAPASAPFFFDHLTRWFGGLAAKDILSANPYKEFVFCKTHNRWNEGYPSIEGTRSNKFEYDTCGVCRVGSNFITALNVRLSIRSLAENRDLWVQLGKEIATAKSKGDEVSLELTRRLTELSNRRSECWIAYECQVWELAESTRSSLHNAMEQKEIPNSNIFNEYVLYNAEWRERAKPPTMLCVVHNKVGDAVPWRNPGRYDPECFVCTRTSERVSNAMQTQRTVGVGEIRGHFVGNRYFIDEKL